MPLQTRSSASGAPSPAANIAQKGGAPVPHTAPAGQVTSQTVSLALVDIVEALALHVPPERRPQVQMLARLAREKPEQEQRVKEQLLVIGGADALRAAVCSLVGAPAKQRSAPPPALQQLPASAPPAPSSSVGFAPLQATGEPPMPPNMQAILGSTQSTQEFKASLIHAFHCRTPSCPVAGCVALTSKLARLQQHVSTCNENACLLCRIWTYLKYYHDAHGPLAAAPSSGLQMPGMPAGAQLLPQWHSDGRITWATPGDALNHLSTLTDGHSIDEPPAKRQNHGAHMSIGDLTGLQGVLPDPPGMSNPAHSCSTCDMPLASAPLAATPPAVRPAMPRIATSGAPASSMGLSHIQLPTMAPLSALPSFDFEQLTSADPLGVSRHGGAGRLSGADSSLPPSMGKHKRALTSEPTKTSSTFARSSSGLHVPLLKPPTSDTRQLPQLPSELRLEGLSTMGTKSFNLSGNLAELFKSSSNLDLTSGNLAEFLKSSSNLDWTLGLTSSDLGSADAAPKPSQASTSSVTDFGVGGLGVPRGLSFVRSGRSGGVDRCASDISISGFLNEGEMGGSGPSHASDDTPPMDASLHDIMSDFAGGGSMPSDQLISA
eukprot:CAMPEP_0115847502 /NCGR_PEP_ID=MMETSP0287-20121206/10416_1 /TAXON_ID=412157 /ORGANISM="Chrysochromulina rotalis, Strain UIO044" /LENGTH=603 /DNA_ID=CAMNT_0003301339 /DNA_START=20 /DNA_END=1831 /DNA_ORIENTATION=+